MELVDQQHYIKSISASPLESIEQAGRVCYKSEDKITKGSAVKFVRMVVKRGHESVIEHTGATVWFSTNRGVTHELVRHRLCAFSQASTRYIRYDNNMEFIRPVWIDPVWCGKWTSENFNSNMK